MLLAVSLNFFCCGERVIKINFKRTVRRATQGPNQILQYIARRSFALMHISLVLLHNLLEEINGLLLEEIRLTSMVTLGTES